MINKESNLNNKKNSYKRRKNLNYIAFLKLLAMIIIIRWHCVPLTKFKIDYGARMCEFLFVSSGFLVGYNYYKRPMPSTYQSSIKYAYKHLRIFYPLELINILYFLCIYRYKFKKTYIEIILINFFLLKAWAMGAAIKYFNGVSWFYSALILCYFLTPFLLGGIKNLKISLILFTLIALIRFSVEDFVFRKAVNVLKTNFHYGPVIRSMEFFLGMLMVPLYYKIKSYIDIISNLPLNKITFTIIQIELPIYLYYLMEKYNNILHRGYFVLIFCLFTFISALDYGYLSKIVKIKLFQIIMSCQMEMYMLQILVPHLITKILLRNNWDFSQNIEILFYVKLFCIFIFAFIYKNSFRAQLAYIMDVIVYFIIKNLN